MEVEPAMIMAGQTDHVNRSFSQRQILTSVNVKVEFGVVSTEVLCNTYSQMQRQEVPATVLQLVLTTPR